MKLKRNTVKEWDHIILSKEQNTYSILEMASL